MRITLIAGALAAAVGLAACSGGSQAVPSGYSTQAVAPMAHSGLHLGLVGAKPDRNCPSKYIACVTVNSASGGSIGLCVQTSSGCESSPFTWSSAFYTKKNAPFKRFAAVFYPNPGNPVTDTIYELKMVKPSNGKYNWYQAITVCPTSGSCLSANIGLATS